MGELLSEVKRRIRDGESHTKYDKRLVEEVGDILWYLASFCTHSDLIFPN